MPYDAQGNYSNTDTSSYSPKGDYIGGGYVPPAPPAPAATEGRSGGGPFSAGGSQTPAPLVPSGYYGNPTPDPVLAPMRQNPMASWGRPMPAQMGMNWPQPAYQFGRAGQGTQFGQPITGNPGNVAPNPGIQDPRLKAMAPPGGSGLEPWQLRGIAPPNAGIPGPGLNTPGGPTTPGIQVGERIMVNPGNVLWPDNINDAPTPGIPGPGLNAPGGSTTFNELTGQYQQGGGGMPSQQMPMRIPGGPQMQSVPPGALPSGMSLQQLIQLLTRAL